jgi:3-dehydroquinate synthase
MRRSARVQIEVPSASGAYTVAIGAGLLSTLPALTPVAARGRQHVVVSTAPIWRRHGARLRAIAGRDGPVLIPDGERAKSLAVVERLYREFSRRRLDRSAVVVAFGGGVVGDAAGFAAATYLRGVRLIQAPTTLLAQVDSAIGGKVGVNLRAGKNLVGAFHPPILVVCDPSVLVTLAAREFRAGLFEVVKYGAALSSGLFERLERDLAGILTQAPEATSPVVEACCRLKAEVVAADERESGRRRVLNFGHTVGHALEAITHYRRFRHGEAIAHGMLAIAQISRARGTLGDADARRIALLIERVGRLPRVSDLSARRALAAIGRDKKMDAGRLHVVLAQGLGNTAIASDVSDRELLQAMRGIGMRP